MFRKTCTTGSGRTRRERRRDLVAAFGSRRWRGARSDRLAARYAGASPAWPPLFRIHG